jgi:hypothetical protein
MRIVDHNHRTEFLCRIAYRRQIGDRAIHREDTVGCDKFVSRSFFRGFAELLAQVGRVVVPITVSLCFAESDSVDDGSVVQLITYDRIFFA